MSTERESNSGGKLDGNNEMVVEFPTPSSPHRIFEAKREFRKAGIELPSHLRDESSKTGDKTFNGWKKLRWEVKEEKTWNEQVEKTKEAILFLREQRKKFLLEEVSDGSPSRRRLRQAIKSLEFDKLKKEETLLRSNEAVFVAAKVLIQRDELTKGFVWTDHHLKEYEWLARQVIESGHKPVLEYGPSGTGKTELVRAFAQDFIGQHPIEVRGNEHTRMAEFVGETGLRASNNTKIEDLLSKWNEAKVLAEKSNEMDKEKAFEQALQLVGQTIGITTETYKTLGKIGEALDQARQYGRAVLLIDEYNRIPADVVGGGLKGFFRELRKAGVVIIATANLKDGKHKGVRELEPQETREFTSHTFSYIPREDLKTLCLAAITEEDGLIRIQKEDQTLDRFVTAITKCQQGYTGKLPDLEEFGQSDSQKKGERTIHTTIVEQGRFFPWLLSFKTQQNASLYTHLSEKIRDFLVNLPSGTIKEQEDRNVLAHIFASQGFDIGDAIHTTYVVQINNIKSMDKNPMKLLSLKELFGVHTTQETGEEKESKLVREALIKQLEGEPAERIGDLVFETLINEQKAFYQRNSINEGTDFERKAREIWNRNFAEIKKEIEAMGYDGVLFVPEGLVTQTLHDKMTEGYEASWFGDNLKNVGGLASIPMTEKMQLVLYHKTENVQDNQIANLTKGKSIINLYEDVLTPEKIEDRILNQKQLGLFKIKDELGKEYKAEGLSLLSYILIQRMYFEETQTHMDNVGWNWTPGTTMVKNNNNGIVSSLVAVAYWRPVSRRLSVNARAPSDRLIDYGCRLSRCFE